MRVVGLPSLPPRYALTRWENLKTYKSWRFKYSLELSYRLYFPPTGGKDYIKTFLLDENALYCPPPHIDVNDAYLGRRELLS